MTADTHDPQFEIRPELDLQLSRVAYCQQLLVGEGWGDQESRRDATLLVTAIIRAQG